MKFKELLAEVSGEVAEYRRDIFNTIILGLIIETRGKCVYHIFRTFQLSKHFLVSSFRRNREKFS